ncbi:hypothetical protein NC653_016395 [Populus alba x Populus x berolinensis]|uniref:Uncharacterized protein n=1 Tax=Populus alba x Populus x berolinensis TaxID=444605 RepID=A0AAD6VZL5_9ROSI|nr:hypothetical protein NC653_016395 [Populus alba x Populus x berolinensis]
MATTLSSRSAASPPPRPSVSLLHWELQKHVLQFACIICAQAGRPPGTKKRREKTSKRLVFQLFVLGELETLGFSQYSTYDDIVVENQSSFCPRVLAGAPRSTISSVNFHLIALGHWI